VAGWERVGAASARFVFRNLEATPRIELGMEVLQIAPRLSTKCNEGQSVYETHGVKATE
jgi:hypothetical protein